MREEIFNMTQKEITRLRVINQTIDGVLTIREAAELLNLSERQVLRLKKGVVEQGPAFIIHKNRGRKPKHAIADDIKSLIVELKKTKYEEANFSHFQELIMEHESINISYSTVHRTLTDAGIKSPKKHRKRNLHNRRKRKPQKGMLVQIDASPHEWIIGCDPFDLHGAIDDATGEILALYFTPNECMEGYFEIVRQMVTTHGIPTSLYCDRHTIFVSPNDGKLSIEDQLAGKNVNLTQFSRAMEELGINIIKAHSPQAKGQIESFGKLSKVDCLSSLNYMVLLLSSKLILFYLNLWLSTIENLAFLLKIILLLLELWMKVLILIIYFVLKKSV